MKIWWEETNGERWDRVWSRTWVNWLDYTAWRVCPEEQEGRQNIQAAAAAKSLQSCPTLCNPIDGSPPGSPVPGILQARTPEWVAISFSSAWKWKVKVKSLSRVRPSATPRTAAYQAPPSMGFSRQEYWSGVPLPSPYTGWGANDDGWVMRICILLLIASVFISIRSNVVWAGGVGGLRKEDQTAEGGGKEVMLTMGHIS